jgi:hypothetical protein
LSFVDEGPLKKKRLHRGNETFIEAFVGAVMRRTRRQQAKPRLTVDPPGQQRFVGRFPL